MAGQNLRPNDTNHHMSQYSFISPCWGEMNFVRTYGLPVVFRQMETGPDNKQILVSEMVSLNISRDMQEQKVLSSTLKSYLRIQMDFWSMSWMTMNI